MVRAQAVVSPLDEEVAHAGDALMLLISRSVWDVCLRQAKAEGVEPGTILSKAVTQYMDAHGSEDVKAYLATLTAEARRASR